MKIEFNTLGGTKGRQETKPLFLHEETEVVETINNMLAGNLVISKDSFDQLQRFINHYQNLSHHMATTCGLWATDRKELVNHEDFFEIKF
jgi:hypothetical protein